MEQKIFHLGVGIPSLESWHPDFALCLFNALADFKSHAMPGYTHSRVSVYNLRSSSIAALRQEIAETAVKDGCDYLLWADCDQTFTNQIVRRLVAHNKDVIGCNVAVKKRPSLPTARSYNPKFPLIGDIVYTKPDSTGIEKIWRLGCGIMLVKTSVFAKLTVPYFNFSWNETTKFVGEDWYFCQKLEAAGIDIWIDHDMSKEIGHIGSYNYGHKDVDYKGEFLRVVHTEAEL